MTDRKLRKKTLKTLKSKQVFFPAAAIYLAMIEVNADMAYDIMKKVMEEKSSKTGRTMAKCCSIPGFKKFFLRMWDLMSHKMSGEDAGFKNTFYPKQKNCFRMDILRCPYNKYLNERGSIILYLDS